MIRYHHGAAILLVLLSSAGVHADGDKPGFVQRTVNAFEQSEIVFQRSISNTPFPPLAFLNVATYSDVEVESRDGRSLTYDVDRLSQMAAVPFLVSERDALIVGEYVSWTRFNLDVDGRSKVDVSSIGLPLGWFRQVNPDWQAAAFVMPLGHDADLPRSDWAWQYLGGAFARYVQDERLWWAFGFYFDLGAGEDFYIPYLGASWAINERWTLSAVMPWPALVYAPNERWMVRLGASPSGASWSLDLDNSEVGVNLDAWDVGLGIEHRFAGNLWLGARAGVGGLRGLRLENSKVEEPDIDISSNFFLGLTLNYRPAVRP